MKKSMTTLSALAVLVLFLAGCLTVEKKEYSFVLNDETNGTLTIKYINIMSIMDDTIDVSQEDFSELIGSYIEGDALVNEFPNAQISSKRLFEENGVLCGEVVLDFVNIQQVRLYRYNDLGPYMYCVNCSPDAETYELSNGTYGGEAMPVIFWEEDLRGLNLTTLVTYPDETTVSLLGLYKEWEEE